MKKIYRYYKKIKYNTYLKKFKKCGDNFISSFKTCNFSFNTISIGNNVYIGSGAWFFADLTIGNNVMFGPSCKIIGGDHIFGILGKSNRFLKPVNKSSSKPIIIEDEVWCGANVIILKGVKIGMGCVVGAGSVVSKDLPPYTVNIGFPCKTVKKIFTDKELEEHLLKLGYSDNTTTEVISQRSKLLTKNGLFNLPYHNNLNDYTEIR